MLQKTAEHSVEGLRTAIGRIADTFNPAEFFLIQRVGRPFRSKRLAKCPA
jgi:hypothetical protein